MSWIRNTALSLPLLTWPRYGTDTERIRNDALAIHNIGYCFVELLGLAVTRACCGPPPPRCPPRSSRPARPTPQSWPTPSCPAAPRL
jgi:hypothetical protein